MQLIDVRLDAMFVFSKSQWFHPVNRSKRKKCLNTSTQNFCTQDPYCFDLNFTGLMCKLNLKDLHFLYHYVMSNLNKGMLIP
jgi:hypothetical protein